MGSSCDLNHLGKLKSFAAGLEEDSVGIISAFTAATLCVLSAALSGYILCEGWKTERKNHLPDHPSDDLGIKHGPEVSTGSCRGNFFLEWSGVLPDSTARIIGKR